MAEANWHPKREARPFEPPPWEREQFEALQKRREPQPADEVEQAAAPSELHPQPAEEQPESVVATAGPADTREARALPVAEVEAMLVRLRAEEPRVDEHVKSVTVFASAIAMLLGVSMIAWGLFALMAEQKSAATLVGAIIVSGMGVVFALTGLWAGWRATNKQEESS